MWRAALLLLLISPAAHAQSLDKVDGPRVADWSGGYFASFYLIEDAPRGLEDFEAISIEYLPGQENDETLLIPDAQGNIQTSGSLRTKNGTSYKFSRSRLIEGDRLIKLSFATETVDGVSYNFEGEYLRDYTEIRKGDLIIGYVHLEGLLRKYRDGLRVSQAMLGLTPRGIE